MDYTSVIWDMGTMGHVLHACRDPHSNHSYPLEVLCVTSCEVYQTPIQVNVNITVVLPGDCQLTSDISSTVSHCIAADSIAKIHVV